jgi:hypothetical protein
MKSLIVVLLVSSLTLCSCTRLLDYQIRKQGGWYDHPLQPAATALEALTRPADPEKQQPILLPVVFGEAEHYQLAAPWSFRYRDHIEEVPEGLVVDGASVPRAVWSFMPPDGLHRGAALAHDWLYSRKGRLSNGDTLTRPECDCVFYSRMVDAGVSKWRAGVAYRAVRMGGWLPWSRSSGQPTVLPVLLSHISNRRHFINVHLYAE